MGPIARDCDEYWMRKIQGTFNDLQALIQDLCPCVADEAVVDKFFYLISERGTFLKVINTKPITIDWNIWDSVCSQSGVFKTST